MTTSAMPAETAAFLDSLQHIAPRVVSACKGWTTHEITAHLAANAAEISAHVEAYAEGRPVPRTRGWEEREAPFRALDDAVLRRRLETEEERMRRGLDALLARDPDAVITWTGRRMAIAKFVPHMRNEFAVHRWDVTGDDETSFDLLGQADLTEHAVTVLGALLTSRGREIDPRPGEDFHVRLRAEGAADVDLVIGGGEAALRMAGDGGDAPAVELDPAARALVIWGRRPARRDRFRSPLPAADLARLEALLSGY